MRIGRTCRSHFQSSLFSAALSTETDDSPDLTSWIML